jgi:type IV secretory pathway VirB4 component
MSPASRGHPGLLRPARQRATTANLASLYPFHAGRPLGTVGAYLGVDLTGSSGVFRFDPFALYQHGTLTNPNVLVVGEVGSGKSALVKAFLRRSLLTAGRRRFVAVLDPKGEYGPFAHAHGLASIRLRAGGSDRVNPMDPPEHGAPADSLARQSLAAALVEAVLGRSLDPLEDALLGWAINSLARAGRPFTLLDVLAATAQPGPEVIELARRTPLELAHLAAPVVFGLDKLCRRSLTGMFDGPTTLPRSWRDGPGVVVDLSGVHADRHALPLVMLAATTWLTGTLTSHPERRTIQVIDEAWAAVAHGARHFQATLKLSRSLGVSTWLICHRPADLTAQAQAGTVEARIAEGLVADLQTRVLFRQPSDQIAAARELFALTDREAGWLGQLVRGRALWRLGGRGAVVQTVLSARERVLFDSDGAMA